MKRPGLTEALGLSAADEDAELDSWVAEEDGEQDEEPYDLDGVAGAAVPRIWRPPCSGLTDLFYGERVWDAQQAAAICRGVDLVETEVQVEITSKRGEPGRLTVHETQERRRRGGPCPAIEECLDAAVQRGETCGVWGGMLMTGRGPRDPDEMADGRLLHKRRRGE